MTMWRRHLKQEQPNSQREQRHSTVIAISSYQPQYGCTYVSKLFEQFLLGETNYTVCLLYGEHTNLKSKQLLNPYYILRSDTMSKVEEQYDYIIIDLGNFDDMTELDRETFSKADIKLMVCHLEDQCLRRIADEIRKQPEVMREEYIFLFNQVLKKERKHVDDLMENYNHGSIETVDIRQIDKKTKQLFSAILHK